MTAAFQLQVIDEEKKRVFVHDYSKRVEIGRQDRGEAGPYSQKFEADRWRRGLLHTGHRAALVASGDVLGAFEQIVRDDRELAGAASRGGESLLAAARDNAEIVEMINFALSDELTAICRRLGVD